MDELGAYIQFLFSWVLLTPLSIILSGKLIAKNLILNFDTEQVFVIKIPILRLSAQGDEAIIGFTGYLFVFFIIGMAFGQIATDVFEKNFGLQIGQYNALACISALSFLFVSVLLLLFFHFGSIFRGHRNNDHNDMIDRISKKDD